MTVAEEYLYHYTSADGLLGIVQSRSIWATEHEYLNDTLEGGILVREMRRLWNDRANNWLKQYPEDYIESLDEYLNSSRSASIACFSRVKDSLTQYRMYSPKEGGYCIGFPRSYLERAGTLLNVDYDEKSHARWCRLHLQDVLETVEQAVATGERSPEILADQHRLFEERCLHSFACKSREFRAEEEVRLVVTGAVRELVRASRSGNFLIPYCIVPLPDEEVTVSIDVGPGIQRDLAKRGIGALNSVVKEAGTRWKFTTSNTKSSFRDMG